MGATSEHFKDGELSCKHCGVNDCQQPIVDALEQFRALVGKPVIIDDAYRCPAHNLAVGGVSDSEHVQGIAADICVEGMSGAELEAAALKCPLITAIGRSDDPAYIHVDTRPMSQGHARWAYAPVTGKWCAWFPAPPAAAVGADIGPV